MPNTIHHSILRTRFTLFFAALVLAAGFIFTGCSEDESSSVTEEGGYKRVSISDSSIRWKIAGNRIEINLTAPTEGWIAIGFNPTRGMEDANFILGYVKEGKLFLRDDYGTWFSSHESDESLGGKNDVTAIGGKESDETTEISFSIPLDSGDEYDQVITPGEEHTVLFAYGRKDDFSSIHSFKTKLELTF